MTVEDDNTVTGRFYFWRPVAQRGFWLDLTGTLAGNDLTGIEIRVDLCTDSLTVASVPVTPGVVNGPAVPRVNIDLGSVDCDAPGGVRPLRLELEKCPDCP